MYLNDFCTWLQNDGRARKTIQTYQRIIQDLATWYTDSTGEPFDPQQVTALDLHNWRSYLETIKKQKPATVNKKIAALKTYWSFLVDTSRGVTDPTRKVKMRTISTSGMAPKWLEPREVSRFLQMIESESIEKNDWRRLRNVALVQMMLQGGLRISEVSALSVDDIDLSHRKHEVLTVRLGKGDKYRVVPMNRDLAQATRAWLDIRASTQKEIKDPDALFLSQKRSRITDRAIRNVIIQYFQMALLPDATPHTLRHTCAKRLIDQGNPIQYVSKILGHENIQTTERYTLPSEYDLRKAVESISDERSAQND